MSKAMMISNEANILLQAHHIRSWSKFPALHYKVENGITLCVACHKIVNEEQRIAEKSMEVIEQNASHEQETTDL